MLTGALNDLAGDGISGATGLLGGNVGEFVVFGVAVVIIGVIVGALFYFASFGKRK